MSIILNFEGYWNLRRKQFVPSYQGIYVVFAADYQIETPIVSSLRVLYIDTSNNINQTINEKDNIIKWNSELFEGEQLFFCATYISDKTLLMGFRDNLVYVNQPILNKKPTLKKAMVIECTGMFYGLKKYTII